MSTPQLTGPSAPPAPFTARLLLAAALLSAGRALLRLAGHFAHLGQTQDRGEPVYEFYAEAGAPEGALYLDGQLVGHVPGVTRL